MKVPFKNKCKRKIWETVSSANQSFKKYWSKFFRLGSIVIVGRNEKVYMRVNSFELIILNDDKNKTMMLITSYGI